MALTKLTIPPDQPSYSVKDGKETLFVQLDGGEGRYRKDIINSASGVNVQWTVGPDKYRYLRAFYNSVSVSGAIPFLIDLYLDEAVLTEHEAHFIPNSFRLSSQRGLEFTVVAQLEVKPDVADPEYDQSLVDLYNAYGSFGAAEEVLNQLEILTNIDLPGSLPG